MGLADRGPRALRTGSRAAWIVARGGLLGCGRSVGPPEVFAAALDRGDELGEVDLEGAEDLVGVVLGALADPALLGAGVIDDLLARELGPTRAVMLGDELGLAFVRRRENPLGLALGRGEHLIALLDDPARLLHLLRNRGAQLVKDVVELFLFHAHLAPQ